MVQKVKDENWIDETGKKVPVKYVGPLARLKEQRAGSMLKEAKSLNKNLKKFKKGVEKECQEIFEKAMKEFNARAEGKGNFTWFNFDRSIKVEVSISNRIEFDDLGITACKGKLDEFLDENLDSKQEFVKSLVTDAFSTSKGKLDARR